MDFASQLKAQINIVQEIGEYVKLKKASRDSWKGLCPFHSEKSPSFNVHEAKQFYHCFGCHAGGDVFKFVQEIEGISFYEALKGLAEKHGVPMPKRSQYADEDSRKRGSIFTMHELAQEQFRANLQGTAGGAARAYLEQRGLGPETIERFGLGYSLPTGRALLKLFEERGFMHDQLEESGLVGKRQDGSGYYDRFRNRLMFPIHNETGKIIGFGGRALTKEDEPKYLNSPETPIYKKSLVLYNLHRAKEAIRKEDRAILVEGYMDAIGVMAAGVSPVVAVCGTALTAQQVRMLKRFSTNAILNFDPDAAGAKAVKDRIPTLLDESMRVRVMELDEDLDPDEYCKKHGAEGYRARLDSSKNYFYWLADQAKQRFDVRATGGRGVASVLNEVLQAVHHIGDRMERMAVANDLAGYIGVEPGMVLDAFKKAAGDMSVKTIAPPKISALPAERGLIHVLLSGDEAAAELVRAVCALPNLAMLETRRILQAAEAVQASGAPITMEAVSARLEENDRELLAAMVFAEESELTEPDAEHGYRCLETLREDARKQERTQLKKRINEVERTGNWQEAMRLMQELQALEAGNSRGRGTVQ